MRARHQRRQWTITPRPHHPDAHRVLLIRDQHLRAPAVDDLFAGAVQQMADEGLPASIDVLDDLKTGMRLAAGQPHALARYDAVVVLTEAERLAHWARTARRQRAQQRLLAAVPVLIVEVGASAAPRPNGRPHPSRSATPILRPALLGLARDCDFSTAANQIARSLQALISRKKRASPGAQQPGTPAHDFLLRRGVDATALSRLRHITRLTQNAYGLATAEINLLGRTRITGITSTETAGTRIHPRADSLCDLASHTPGLTLIPDTRTHPEARTRTPAQGADAIRFYAAETIRSPSGDIIAALCIHDPRPHQPAEFDFSLLHDLALLAEGELIDAAHRTRH